ncbi:hypothetical protein STEG23_029045, partial [Scotinomys teguina]
VNSSLQWPSPGLLVGMMLLQSKNQKKSNNPDCHLRPTPPPPPTTPCAFCTFNLSPRRKAIRNNRKFLWILTRAPGDCKPKIQDRLDDYKDEGVRSKVKSVY